MADASDLKSDEHYVHAGSSPASVTHSLRLRRRELELFDSQEYFSWQEGICDWCYEKHFHNRAIEKAPDVFEKNGTQWKGGKRTKELGETWREACRKTEEEMKTSCATFPLADGDYGRLCKNCLIDVIEQHKGD